MRTTMPAHGEEPRPLTAAETLSARVEVANKASEDAAWLVDARLSMARVVELRAGRWENALRIDQELRELRGATRNPDE
ncbi:hypothetical protein [Streptomyces eurocidicus]|nr:hypothetical protein [Streptomyces eurocidicus]MBB5122893.1 hypothetical protein [Streptomyces eurocidicus]MBF6056316.1 hypothetical protein [Streptomyces eurocidicus]